MVKQRANAARPLHGLLQPRSYFSRAAAFEVAPYARPDEPVNAITDGFAFRGMSNSRDVKQQGCQTAGMSNSKTVLGNTVHGMVGLDGLEIVSSRLAGAKA